MPALHELVLHGAAVWRAALAVLVLAGAVAGHQRSRRRARVEAGALRASLGSVRTELDGVGEGTTVTLAGKLRAAGASCACFEDGSDAAAASAGPADVAPVVDVRAGELALVLDDVTVVLEGPVSVMVGSRETRTERPIEGLDGQIRARVEDAGAAWTSPRPALFRSLRSGDSVIARGVLHRRDAAAGSAGYRVAGGSWSLGAPPTDPAHPEASGITLAAHAVARVSAPAGRSALLGAGAGALLFGALFVVIPSVVDLRGARPEIIGLLAVTPLRSDEASLEYRATLAAALLDRKLDPEVLDRLVEADVAEGACGSAASVLLDHGQRARAADLAERCGAPIEAAKAAFEMGDFERSARQLDKVDLALLTPPDVWFAVLVHLLVGHLEASSAAARRLVADAQRGGLGELVEIQGLACFADALDARRGDSAALRRLRSGTGASCALLAGELLPEGQERLRRFIGASYSWAASEYAARGMADLLLAATDDRASFAETTPEAILLGPIEALPLWGLRRALLERLREPQPGREVRSRRASLATSLAALEASSGHLADAVALGDRAADDLAALCAESSTHDCHPRLVTETRAAARVLARQEFDPSVMPQPGIHRLGEPVPGVLLPALLALRGRREVDEGVFQMTAGELEDIGKLVSHGIDAENFDLAAGGMSIPLARLLWRTRVAPPRLLRMIGLTNRSAAGRDELRFWLRWGAVTRCHGCEVSSTFADIAARLTLAEALGDRALVAELRPIVESFRAVLLRAETAIPLAVLESLEHPRPRAARPR